MTSQLKLTRKLRKGCREAFLATRHGLKQWSFKRPIEHIALRFKADHEFNARLWPSSAYEPMTVEINDGLLVELYSAILDHEDDILLALHPSPRSSKKRQAYKQDILETVYTLSVHFVLQHELGHLLCGHVDMLKKENKKKRTSPPYQESSLGLQGRKKGMSAAMRHKAYFLEGEADDVAASWMLDQMLFETLYLTLKKVSFPASSCSWEKRTVHQLPIRPRILAFRYLLVVMWIVIVLMESHRDPTLQSKFRETPLPGARLLAVIGTLISWFAELRPEKITASGHLETRITEQQIKRLSVFFKKILKPVAVHLLEFPGKAIVTQLALPLEGNGTIPPTAAIVQDLTRLILQQTPNTKAARELLQIKRKRAEILPLLARFHYHEGLAVQ